MKKHILNLILCLALMLSISVSAAAANLDTTNVSVDKDKGIVVIGDAENEVLTSLHQSGKTAQIAIPLPSDYDAASPYYVQKDGYLVVTDTPVVENGFVRFPVPGAGQYVIKKGVPPTLDEQLSDPGQSGLIGSLSVEVLKENHTVEGNLVIVANGSIKGEGSAKTLTVGTNGTLTVQNLNGSVAVELGAGDAISFGTNGEATIAAAENKNGNTPVGYGSFLLSGVDSQGKAYNRKYFLVRAEEAGKTQDESVTVKADGTAVFSGVFPPVVYTDKEPMHPVYAVGFETYNNTYQQGTSQKLVSRCNGLYEHLVSITLTLQNTTEKITLVNVPEGKVAAGVKVEKGSTLLTLENSYLSTLPVGEHTLTYTFDDYVAGEEPLTGKVKVIQTAPTAVADTTNPKTGDPMMGILATLLGSAAGLTAVCAGKRKQW